VPVLIRIAAGPEYLAMTAHRRHDRDHHRTGATPGPARLLVPALLMAGALGLAACSSGGSASSPTTTGSAPATSAPATTAPTTTTSGSDQSTGSSITIHNFAFSPATVTVAPGATISVHNEDQVAHTLTATGGTFNTGDVSPGMTVTFKAPSTPGRYPYICSIHSFMSGTLIVS